MSEEQELWVVAYLDDNEMKVISGVFSTEAKALATAEESAVRYPDTAFLVMKAYKRVSRSAKINVEFV